MQFKYKRKIVFLRYWLGSFGAKSLDVFRDAGGLSILFSQTMCSLMSAPWRRSHIFDEKNWRYITSVSFFNGTVHGHGVGITVCLSIADV